MSTDRRFDPLVLTLAGAALVSMASGQVTDGAAVLLLLLLNVLAGTARGSLRRDDVCLSVRSHDHGPAIR